VFFIIESGALFFCQNEWAIKIKRPTYFKQVDESIYMQVLSIKNKKRPSPMREDGTLVFTTSRAGAVKLCRK
jgi:hypothetical protein